MKMTITLSRKEVEDAIDEYLHKYKKVKIKGKLLWPNTYGSAEDAFTVDVEEPKVRDDEYGR